LLFIFLNGQGCRIQHWNGGDKHGMILLNKHILVAVRFGRIQKHTNGPQTERRNIMLKLQNIMKFLVCLVLLLSFMGCASTRTSEGTGEYVDDSAITTKVKSAILMDSSLKVMQINVETFKGEVQLSGFVDSAKSATKAAEVARGVKGVVKVKNSLIVK
jgi:hypothetical protein